MLFARHIWSQKLYHFDGNGLCSRRSVNFKRKLCHCIRTEELSVFIAPLSLFTQKLVSGMHLPHSKIDCRTEFGVTEMPVSDTEFWEIDKHAHTVDTIFPLPSAPGTRVQSACASLAGHKDLCLARRHRTVKYQNEFLPSYPAQCD